MNFKEASPAKKNEEVPTVWVDLCCKGNVGIPREQEESE